jgi:hypothetical protein
MNSCYPGFYETANTLGGLSQQVPISVTSVSAEVTRHILFFYLRPIFLKEN